jgi:hypothetical protein
MYAGQDIQDIGEDTDIKVRMLDSGQDTGYTGKDQDLSQDTGYEDEDRGYIGGDILVQYIEETEYFTF